MGRVKGGQSWFERQSRDTYTKKAKHAGLRSRSAFKLEQIQTKYSLIRKHDTVFDLGASPGGWSQYLRKIAKEVVSCDLLDMKQIENVHFIQGDFTDPEVQLKMVTASNTTPTAICSDMPPNITGIKEADAANTLALNEKVIHFSKLHLRKNGYLIIKVFENTDIHIIVDALKKDFSRVIHFKPDASRSTSREFYLIGYKKK